MIRISWVLSVAFILAFSQAAAAQSRNCSAQVLKEAKDRFDNGTNELVPGQLTISKVSGTSTQTNYTVDIPTTQADTDEKCTMHVYIHFGAQCEHVQPTSDDFVTACAPADHGDSPPSPSNSSEN